MEKRWTAKKISNLTGKIAIVTGTGGVGLEDEIALAASGATVVVAGRNPKKGNDAIEKIRKQTPDAKVSFEQIDLASLNSIKEFSQKIRDKFDHVDILINNAGIMTPPERKTTSDGFELQFGTNYLATFALTGALLPLIKKSSDGRIVSLSSIANRQGKIELDNLQAEKEYKAMPAYAQSKLAILMFSMELQRLSEQNGWGIKSIAAHPGVAQTNLIFNGAGRNSIQGFLRGTLGSLFFQKADQAAWPTLYAATASDAVGGEYYGPSRMRETSGYPKIANKPVAANDTKMAQKLWKISEDLTRIHYS